MKKFASDWIEGKGTIQAVIRTLTLWACPNEEHTKLQLLKAIDKQNCTHGHYTLQFAIDRRKKKIQWVFVYLPLFAFSTLGMLLMAGGLFSQNLRILQFSLAVTLCLIFIFRSLWFSHYLECYRMICHAADAIWKDRLEHAVAEKVNTAPLSPVNAQVEKMDIRQIEKDRTDEVEGALPGPGKGSILLFLLKELIKKESGQPNIFSGDLHETILLYADLSGCRPKNILSKTKYYKSRKSLILGTENARTTHRKYLEKLLRHYKAIGDNVLYKGAEDLLAYVVNNSGQKTQ